MTITEAPIKIKEQNDQPESEIDAAVARGSGEVPADKFEAFKSTMARMHQAVTQVGTANSVPTKAAGQAQPPKKPGETQAAAVTTPTKTVGSRPRGQSGQPVNDKAYKMANGEVVDLTFAKDAATAQNAREVIEALTKKNPRITKKELDSFMNVVQNLSNYDLKVVPK